MAKQLTKHMDVDVIAFLEEKMKSNTKHYQTDFEYDKEMFNRFVNSPHKEDRTLLWLSRSHGTQCQKEYETFIKDTAAHNTWMYFADFRDPIVAYCVELTDKKNGVVRGNLYELDYCAHTAEVASKSVSLQESEKTFEDGFELHVPPERGSLWFYHSYVERHGEIVHSLDRPKDIFEHAYVLEEQKAARDELKEVTLTSNKRKTSLSEKIQSASEKAAQTSALTSGKVKEGEMYL